MSETNMTLLKKINTPNRADAWRKKRNQPLISLKDAFPFKITKIKKKMYFIGKSRECTCACCDNSTSISPNIHTHTYIRLDK